MHAPQSTLYTFVKAAGPDQYQPRVNQEDIYGGLTSAKQFMLSRPCGLRRQIGQ